MEEYLAPLIQSFVSLADTGRAKYAKAYMRNKFEFLGIDAPTRKKVLSALLKENPLPEVEKLEALSLYLWRLPEREYQFVALDILQKQAKKLREQDIEWIEELIVSKSWWDTVDGLAAWVCGTYFKMYPSQIPGLTQKWMNSRNMWLQRACLLFQLKYKKDTDTELLQKLILDLADHPDFFIRKAIGWVLREYSKTDANWVHKFLEINTVSNLSRKEGSKYL